MAPNAHSSRQVALALASLCLGGMVLARAVEDRALADELREATMAVGLRLGHWT
jgi:TetR/AcrR family transcriptional repressor of nem operon